ncbi:hypothetical protein HD554DRAFT_2039155 [Boletus coccyginus]|nr:hypothetical protein HD554DRAFT_2039155 [Boletus coccyginus]
MTSHKEHFARSSKKIIEVELDARLSVSVCIQRLKAQGRPIITRPSGGRTPSWVLAPKSSFCGEKLDSHLLRSFLALLGTVHGDVSPVAECSAQVWVRAPDLAPDTIVRGDVRVKISAGCPVVETVLLGLRLKERSVMKALYDPLPQFLQTFSGRQETDAPFGPATDFPPSPFSNGSDEIAFLEMLANKDLWLVREEERLVFETSQVIRVADEASGDCDVVQDFAVLVPSTNFPPAVDSSTFSIFMMRGDVEMVNVEFMYEDFIRVPFSNGTTEEISVGHTSFQPLYNPADTPQRPSSETIGLEPRHFGVPRKDPPITNYTAQVSGLAFTQGSEDQAVTVVITRTGPARTFTAPLTDQYPDPNVFYVLHRRMLKQDAEGINLGVSADVMSRSLTMPNSTLSEIQSGDIVTTTSAAVTIPIEIDRRQITNFETYYQTLANSLWITLETPRSVDETVDPDDLSAELPFLGFSLKMTRNHMSDDSDQVILPGATSREQRRLIHYLDEGARGLTFVDRIAVHELLAEDPAEREPRAPFLEPVVSSPPEGEELIHRSYSQDRKPLIYVGELVYTTPTHEPYLHNPRVYCPTRGAASLVGQ